MAPTNWGDNIRRLFGMHDLNQGEASELLGVSPQAVSEWVSKTRKDGTRQPNLNTLLTVGEFFQVRADLLVTADFADLLDGELGDPQRFREVETKLRHGRLKLVAVPSKSLPVRETTAKRSTRPPKAS